MKARRGGHLLTPATRKDVSYAGNTQGNGTRLNSGKFRVSLDGVSWGRAPEIMENVSQVLSIDYVFDRNSSSFLLVGTGF